MRTNRVDVQPIAWELAPGSYQAFGEEGHSWPFAWEVANDGPGLVLLRCLAGGGDFRMEPGTSVRFQSARYLIFAGRELPACGQARRLSS